MKKSILLLLLFGLCFQVAKSETEPNDSPAQANVFTLGSTQTGSISFSDYQDWYLLNLPQSGTLALPISFTGSGWMWIRLYDAETTGFPLITEMQMTGGSIPSGGYQLAWALLAGQYYVKIEYGGEDKSYTFSSNLTPPDFPEDVELNNTALQAAVMPANGTVSGNVSYYHAGVGVDQEDWYKIDVPYGGIFHLNIQKHGYQPTTIHFRDGLNPGNPDIVGPIFLDWNDSPPEGWDWSYPLLSGPYYFQVLGNNDPMDYSLTNTIEAPQWGEDTEPNSVQSEALTLAVGDSIGGMVGYYKAGTGVDLEDWYLVDVPTAGLLSFHILKEGYQPATAYLYNANGQIAEQYLNWNADDVTLSRLVTAGQYWLMLKKGSSEFRYKAVSSLLPAPVADFSYAQTGNIFTFENHSLNGGTYGWSFDDGNTATTVNAYHEYALPGNFDVCLIANNVGGADTVCQLVVMPGVARALPAEGGNTGDVTVQVFGGGLDTNYVARIMSGSTVIATSNFTGFAGKSSIFVRFDLREKPVGNYELRIEKAGGPSYTVPGGFNIVQGVAADPWASISGRDRILFNTWTTYTVNYGNRGNVDANTVPVWLAFSNNSGLQVEFENVKVFDWDTLGVEPPAEVMFEYLDSLFGKPNPTRVYPLIFPVIEAGSTNSMKIRVKTSGNLKIHAWAEKPWFQSPINQNKLECHGDVIAKTPDSLGLKDKVECVKLLTVYIFLQMDRANRDALLFGQIPRRPIPPFVSTLIRNVRLAAKICGVTDSLDRKEIGRWVANIIINEEINEAYVPAITSTISDERSGENCPAEFEPQNPTTNTVTAVSSLDPNEKSGPSGFGTENYMRDTRSFPYTIHFENMATATAPAHTVTVTDQLNVAKFDLATFSFGNVYIGDSVLYVEPGLREFVLDKQLDNLGVTARVHGRLDMQTGLLTWTFRSLDATTLEDIEDPDLGFLPPNVTSPEGQGAVSFFVKLKNAPLNNQQVKNTASIVFDANPAIVTNEHLVTFDLVAPQSAILPIDPVQGTAQVELNWSGTDVGSGIQHYNIYYIQNGTDTVLWQGGTTETTAIFTGEGGNTYEFYSIAVDNVGNAEAAPGHPDAVTTIVTETDEQFASNADLLLYPNPASDQLTIINRSDDEGCLTLVQTDGRVVAKLRLQGNGQQQVNVASVPQGLLQWRWSPGCEGAMQTGRVLVVRK